MHENCFNVWWQCLSSSSSRTVGIWTIKISKSILCSLGESQELVESDPGGNVGKLSQDLKVERSCRSFHVVFLKSFGIMELFLFLHELLHGLLNCLLSWFGKICTASSYFFKYCLPDWVLNVGEASWSTARTNSSSSESMREVTPSSVSFEETLITLQEDALSLSLDFLLDTVVHCWLLIMLE